MVLEPQRHASIGQIKKLNSLLSRTWRVVNINIFGGISTQLTHLHTFNPPHHCKIPPYKYILITMARVDRTNARSKRPNYISAHRAHVRAVESKMRLLNREAKTMEMEFEYEKRMLAQRSLSTLYQRSCTYITYCCPLIVLNPCYECLRVRILNSNVCLR